MISRSNAVDHAIYLGISPHYLKEVEKGDFSHINEQAVFGQYFNTEQTKKTKTSKNVLIAFLDEQKAKRDLPLTIPFQNYCPTCLGRGYEIMSREKTIVTLGCDTCDETGVKKVMCIKCQGTGTRKDGSKCFTCKGSGKFYLYRNNKRGNDIPCPRCKGQGEIEKLITGPELISIRTCQTCKGDSRDPKSFGNPLIHPPKRNNDIYTSLYLEEVEGIKKKYFG